MLLRKFTHLFGSCVASNIYSPCLTLRCSDLYSLIMPDPMLLRTFTHLVRLYVVPNIHASCPTPCCLEHPFILSDSMSSAPYSLMFSDSLLLRPVFTHLVRLRVAPNILSSRQTLSCSEHSLILSDFMSPRTTTHLG